MSFEALTEQVEQSQQLDWLVWSLREARVRGVSDRALIDAVRRGLPRTHRQRVLKEIERRLEFWSGNECRSLAAALAHLDRQNAKPGTAAQEIDRLLRRLLWQVPGKGARRLAISCAGAPRLQRRMAAWRFFGRHGLDDEARTLLTERAKQESHMYFFRLVANDPELLNRIGLGFILSALDEFYWRGRALQTHLAAGNAPGEVASTCPGETIFAIRRAERTDLVPLAAKLLNDNRSSPKVVSAAIQCFGALKTLTELAKAEAAGQTLLEEAPEQVGQLLSLDSILAELSRDPLDS